VFDDGRVIHYHRTVRDLPIPWAEAIDRRTGTNCRPDGMTSSMVETIVKWPKFVPALDWER
jgi:hypothetical protein